MPSRSKRGPKPVHKRQPSRARLDAQEIEELNARLEEGAPPPGSNPLKMQPSPPGYGGVYKFEELPLSQYTLKGLHRNKFTDLTAIQRAALPHALCGRDILGAAKTGSGKTLAFIIPVLETLYRNQWTQHDGLGALVLSPTRELALQIFDELRKVGSFHDFSAGLLIGGKDVKEERAMVGRMNILVCTPGRLLQHMDETPDFDANNVRVLVLDEADRCMDMGFSACMDAIIANLPRERHTLLFSATQSKKVSDLARLSLSDPEYVAVHAEAPNATPHRLKQAYVTCELHSKMDLLWFFMKTHLKQKTIVFLSTCKQVKFVYEAFKKLRPGVPLKMLHGHMKQMKRMEVFYDFSEAASMVLFATDIAARGLDFPDVDWVVQADCPEDVQAYIHRVGRTARFRSAGQGLLFLLPSEQAMLPALEEAKVPIQKRTFDVKKLTPVTPALTALLAKSEELKATAQGAFVSYFRSVFLNPNKSVFDILKLDAAEYAASLGLPTAPRLRFAEKHAKVQRKKGATAAVPGGDPAEADAEGEGDDDESGSDAGAEEGDPDADQQDRQAGGRDESASGRDEDDDADNDDFLVLKSAAADQAADQDAATSDDDGPTRLPDQALLAEMHKKRKKKKLRIRPDAVSGSKVVFDDDGQALDPLEALARDLQDGGEVAASEKERFERQKALMRQRDLADRADEKQRRLEAKQLKKAKARAARDSAIVEDMGITLGLGSEGEEDDGDDEGSGGRGGRGASPSGGGDDEDAHGEFASGAGAERRKRTGAGAAYRGMRGADDEGNSSELDDDAELPGQRFKRRRQRLAVDAMDVEDQERLALKLLGMT